METKTVRDAVLQVISAALAEVNADRSSDQQFPMSPDTQLCSELDSFELVDLLLGVEKRVSDAMGTSVLLMDARALPRTNSPFSSIGTLTDYIIERLDGKSA